MFAFLLSVQGLLSTGAADSIVFPELRAPDGRILSFADLCNTAGEDGDAASHCGSCSLHKSTALLGGVPVSFDLPSTRQAEQPAQTGFLPKTPERWQYHRRGPPSFI